MKFYLKDEQTGEIIDFILSVEAQWREEAQHKGMQWDEYLQWKLDLISQGLQERFESLAAIANRQNSDA